MFDRSSCWFGVNFYFGHHFRFWVIFDELFFDGRRLSFFEMSIEVDIGERFFVIELYFELVSALRTFASVFRR